MDFKQIYKNKKVLITGHTGFKGSWLTIWLLELGAEVIGYSINDGDDKGIFRLANLQDKIVHVSADVNNLAALKKVFEEHSPDIVFHLAAQPIVTESYERPLETFKTNVLGTLHILECIKNSSTNVGVIVTSDKCYKNKDIPYKYKEDDEMGGKDPYSASKGCAEIITHSYIHSFFHQQDKLVASVRAGNVIGGGDWGKDRIVPDSIRMLKNNSPVFIRNPSFVRPWQHVLDPLFVDVFWSSREGALFPHMANRINRANISLLFSGVFSKLFKYRNILTMNISAGRDQWESKSSPSRCLTRYWRRKLRGEDTSPSRKTPMRLMPLSTTCRSG